MEKVVAEKKMENMYECGDNSRNPIGCRCTLWGEEMDEAWTEKASLPERAKKYEAQTDSETCDAINDKDAWLPEALDC